GEMGSIFEPLVTSGKVDELADQSQIGGLKASLEVMAKDYLRAMRIRRLVQEEFSKLFTGVDVLLAPGQPGPAPKADADLDAPGPPVPEGTPAGLQDLGA